MTSRLRFSSILDLRQRERDQAALVLARIEAEVLQIDRRRQAIAQQRESVHQIQRILRSTIISAHELRSRADFDRALRHDDAQLLKQRAELLVQLQDAHVKVIAAQQEVAKLEKLQQRQRSRDQARLRQQEQRHCDAINATRRTK
jgi:flagellar FliJ protein